MATKARAIPEGFHTITPHIIVRNGTQPIEFYKRAFGAEKLSRTPGATNHAGRRRNRHHGRYLLAFRVHGRRATLGAPDL